MDEIKIKVNDVIQYIDFYGNKLYIETKLNISNDRVEKNFSINYQDLTTLKFEDLDIAFYSLPYKSKQYDEAIYKIRSQVAHSDIKTVILLDKLGWYKGGDRVCYNAGSCIITSDDSKYVCSPELASKYVLNTDLSYTESDTAKGILDIINVDFEYSSVLFFSGLLGLLRQLFIDANIRPACAIYAVGKTQNRKTTLASLCTRIYNRENLGVDSTTQIARVNSSVPALEALIEETKDCAFILDDLFRDPDKRKRKEYEQNVRSILRNYADNSPRKNMRGSHMINSQLIITAEYLIDSITDLGRCFIIHVDRTISSERLTVVQKEPLLLSTFYYYFIEYICKRYDNTVNYIKKEYADFKNSSMDHKGHYERIYETAFLLMCTFKIVLKYINERNLLKDKDDNLMIMQFQNNLAKIIELHSEIISTKETNVDDMNLSRAILYLENSGNIYFGDKGSDCFIHRNALYLTIPTIISGLHKVYNIELSPKKVSAYFANRGISEGYDSRKNRRHVKKYNNKSYLVLNRDALLEDAQSKTNKLKKIM